MKLLNVTAGSILGVYRFFSVAVAFFVPQSSTITSCLLRTFHLHVWQHSVFPLSDSNFFTDIFVKGSCQQACAFSFVLLIFCHFKKFLQRIYLINIL